MSRVKKRVLALQKTTIALVGNPNCGKTTLFNAFTGARQRVGNWSGVTVEKKTSSFSIHSHTIQLVDLPGTYSLTTLALDSAEDESLTAQFLNTRAFNLVLNIVDAKNLERNLYLTLQLMEQNLPVVVALNRVDLTKKEGVQINIKALASQLGCPVFSIVARTGMGLEALKEALISPCQSSTFKLPYPELIEKQLAKISDAYCKLLAVEVAPRYQLLRWLEGESVPCALPLSQCVLEAQKSIFEECGMEPEVVIAKARYAMIEKIMALVYQRSFSAEVRNFSTEIDKVVCHRFWGLPIFLGVMYALFFFAINIGGAFQDFFELASEALFVESIRGFLISYQIPTWLMTLLVSLGKGISTILTFVPVLGAMFFALAFLEDCGYMARGAFVMDRLMRALGLPGKSFVPLIVGFGCNVPAIMGTRALDSKRDRIMAVMMSPFMSCGARLAIFTVFVAAFFPQGGQNIVFLLYLIGIVMAVLTGLLLKKTLLRGEIVPLLMEMPTYQWPHWKSMVLHCWHRLRRFIMNAGKLILPVCMCIGMLNSITLEGQWRKTPDETTVLSVIGRSVVPVFKPLGLQEENWPAAVGLFTGVLAKEVVIGTLNSLYIAPQAHKDRPHNAFFTQLRTAAKTIPANLSALGGAFLNPLMAKIPTDEISESLYGEMVKRFHSQSNAFAYLLFVLLYFPCISATGAMIREVRKGWTIFSICWTTGLAYGVSVIYYQTATFATHPGLSVGWICGCLAAGLLALLGIKIYSRHYFPRIVPTPIILNPVR